MKPGKDKGPQETEPTKQPEILTFTIAQCCNALKGTFYLWFDTDM